MLFSTPSQWVVLALLLVAGWLFGLASHPGGGKWKARYAAERDANARYRKDTDAGLADARRTNDTALAEARARIAELERDANDRTAQTRTDDSAALADARARIAELERENDRLARAAPVTAATIAPRERVETRSDVGPGDRVVVRPTRTAAARPAYPAGERRGWFDWR